MPYVERTLEPVIRRAVQEFPVVVLTGPRQSGKTTRLRHLFAAGYRYASLDTLDIRAAASDDPRGFLALYPSPVIFEARNPRSISGARQLEIEVDLVVDTGTALVPIEVKQSATPNRNMARGIATFRRDMGARVVKGYVVHPGDVTLPLGPDAVAWPFASL